MRRFFRWGCGAALALLLAGFAILLVAWWRSDNDCAQRAATVPKHPMRAIVHCEYGHAEVLKLEAIEKPVPADDQVLIRVHAAAINPLDWHMTTGTPYVMRLDGSLRKPKETRLGADFSGTVEAVGRNVRDLAPGDAVFGTRTGSFAEFIVAAEARLARKPENLTFEQAAAMPVAGVTALQALRDSAKVRAGQRVLINGASGGVGTFAVQIAKSLGAHVTGVCSGRNVELVRSIGADEVIDYTRDDFTRGTQRYDAIIDMVGNHSLSKYRRVLQPNGRYVMVGGPKGKWIAPIDRVLWMAIYSRFVSQKMGMMLARTSKADFEALAQLAREGKLVPVIDRRYTLAEVPEAMRYLETGRARGKVIIAISP
jgi:NADPH:quinone reductase-like Zn-dependent oxidoreductase